MTDSDKIDKIECDPEDESRGQATRDPIELIKTRGRTQN